MSKTLIMVANASAARVFNYLPREDFSLLNEFSHQQARQKGGDLVSDRLGHSEAKGGGHGVFVPASNPKDNEAERFAHELADWLENERTHNRCAQVMLVAEPRFLGLLNKALNRQTAKLVYQSVNKDYSKVPQRELPEMLDLRIG
ncbi:MAG: protein required for attachment to host cells [Psychromonas sp.]|jgi:protein required for attachment to host cells|uniref:host attachment protein n=1 Tax=Psychromonas sp. TaxID=1884585 RepID=UPI0039E4766C